MSQSGKESRYGPPDDDESDDDDGFDGSLPDEVLGDDGERDSDSESSEREVSHSTPPQSIDAIDAGTVETTLDAQIPQHPDEVPGPLPHIFNRGGVIADRDQISVYTLPQTQQQVKQLELDINAEFDDDVQKMDVREALLLAGLNQPGVVIEILRAWGYGLGSD